MTRTIPPSYRIAVSAVGITVLAASALRLLAATAMPGQPWPAGVAPGPLSEPRQHVSQVPAEAPAASCHLTAGELTIDPQDPSRVWAQVRNIGRQPITLWAVEVGWRGPAVLDSVLLRRAGEATSHPVADEPATSPALLFLQATEAPSQTLVLLAGETVEVGLQFARVEADLLAAVGPIVWHMKEGCAAATAVQADPDLRCRMDADPVAPAPEAPNWARTTVRNAASEAVELAAIELVWPAANGALLSLAIDGQQPVEFARPFVASPALIDFRRLGQPPPTIEAGSARRLDFVFENDAAVEPYVLVVTSRSGCAATSTTWLSGGRVDCGTAPVGFEFHGDSAQLRLANRRPISRTLTTLGLFWPVSATGPLSEVRLNGSLAWRGEATSSPAAVRLTGAALPPDSTVELQLVFTGTMRSSLALKGGSGGDYTVVTNFQGGCQQVFSTIAGRQAGCSLSAGEAVLDPANKQVDVQLTSRGGDAILRLASVQWPDRNGALDGVWLDRDLVFRGPAPPSARPLEIPLAGQNVIVPRGQSRQLRLRFADRVTRGGYVLSLTFEDPLGVPCELLVQSAPQQRDCRLSMGRVRTDLRDLLVSLRNEGSDEVEIRYLDVDWPSDGLNGLAQVALVSDAGSQPQIVWAPNAEEPMRTRPPARIVPNGVSSPVIDPGITTTLRLRFTALMDPGEVAQRFRLTVAAVEGCVASITPDGSELPVQRESFGGVIRQLPRSRPGERSLFGVWRIETDRGERLVQVDARTRFNPAAVTPAEGDVVVVRALRTDEGRLLAEEITFRSTAKATTLVGTIDALDGAARPPQWVDVRIGSEVQNVRLTSETVVEGDLAVGAGVTVYGTVSPTGGVTASRITVTRPPQGEFVLVRGIVQEAETGAVLGEQDWIVDKYRVRVPRAYAPDTSPLGSLPLAGQRVEVYGRLTGRDVAVVQKVKLLPTPAMRRISGTLRELPPNSLIGTWVIALEDGSFKSFLVDSLAVVDTSVAPADTGLWVTAVLQEAEGASVALRVRMDWQP